MTDTSYLYDDLDRLSQSFDTVGVVNTYLYDKAGDRTAWITPTAPDTGEMLIVDSAYNPAGQLTSQYRARPEDGATTVGYSYDRDGNRTSEATTSPDGSSTTNYSYTSTGRLKEVSEDDVSTTYGYDGLGRNLTTTQDSWAGTTTTLQSWGGLQPVVQSTDTGTSAMLLRDATGLVALQSDAASDGSSGTLWNLQDRLGSTIATTTGGGYVTDLADYSDFGIPTHTSQGFAGATGYTGETSSPTTGLNSYYARTYEPFTGTWLTPDSYRGTLTDPASQARYGYVAGNPATFIDRNGNRAADPDKPIRPKKSAAEAQGARLTAYGNAFNAAVARGSAIVGNTCTGKACGSGNGPSCYVAICSSNVSATHALWLGVAAPKPYDNPNWQYTGSDTKPGILCGASCSGPKKESVIDYAAAGQQLAYAWRLVVNIVPTVVAVDIAVMTGGTCGMNNHLFVICTGSKGPYFSGGTTWGNTFVANPEYFGREDITPDLLQHEEQHGWDSANMGPVAFYALYPLVAWVEGPCNIFEERAGFAEGHYTECLDRTVAPGQTDSGTA